MRKIWGIILAAVLVLTACGKVDRSDEVMDLLFENELLAVSEDGRWGYVDRTGAFVIEPQFEEAELRFNGRGTALVKRDGLWGFVDRTGRYASEVRYETAPGACVGDGYYCVRRGDGTETYVNHLGEPVSGAWYESVRFYGEAGVFEVKQGGKYGLIRTDGTILLEPKYDRVDVTPFSRLGIFWFLKVEQSEGGEIYLSGAVDGDGKVIFDGFQGSFVKTVFGYSVLATPHPGGIDLPWYRIVDGQGNYVTETGYDRIETEGDDGLALVSVDGKSGYMDQSLAYKIEPQFEDATEFHHGYAAVKVGERWGIMDDTGAFSVEPQYDYAQADPDSPNFRVTLGDWRGVIAPDGEEVAPSQAEDAENSLADAERFSEGEYESVYPVKDGAYAVAEKDGEHWLIDRTGKVVFAFGGLTDPNAIAALWGRGR